MIQKSPQTTVKVCEAHPTLRKLHLLTVKEPNYFGN